MLRSKIERLERSIPVGSSPEARSDHLLSLAVRDAEAADLASRLVLDRERRFPGLSAEEYSRLGREEPLHRALIDRFAARLEELWEGAPLATDDAERIRRRWDGLPPPGLTLPGAAR
jgi:hypothetical protein